MEKGNNKLDNPVWHSLSESHKAFSVDYNAIKFYHPDYCPFGGFETLKNISTYIDEYSKLVDNFLLLAAGPTFKSVAIKKRISVPANDYQ